VLLVPTSATEAKVGPEDKLAEEIAGIIIVIIELV
jgi:hypothetical protein